MNDTSFLRWKISLKISVITRIYTVNIKTNKQTLWSLILNLYFYSWNIDWFKSVDKLKIGIHSITPMLTTGSCCQRPDLHLRNNFLAWIVTGNERKPFFQPITVHGAAFLQDLRLVWTAILVWFEINILRRMFFLNVTCLISYQVQWNRNLTIRQMVIFVYNSNFYFCLFNLM